MIKEFFFLFNELLLKDRIKIFIYLSKLTSVFYFIWEKKEKEELKSLEDEDIIETIFWSQTFGLPNFGGFKIRHCYDMYLPNVANQRERHIFPTIHYIIHFNTWPQQRLPSARTPESRYLITFSMLLGLRRYING